MSFVNGATLKPISKHRYGSHNQLGSMHAVQAHVLFTIVEQFWITNLNVITGVIEIKLTSIASTRLICESLTTSDSKRGEKMLDNIFTILSRPEQEIVEDEHHMPDFGENVGYNTTLVNMYNAGRREEDPYAKNQ
ncbi:Exportin-2 [Abeliophyllum distichum]|uniref:Exportin-2 n=1 Tax=Abeliophyllum distichum TaxID=126358 RepID=A0ABD1UNE9_9LAMI